MIIVKIGGGLGNQLYQYAFARYLACKYNTELKLDINHLKSHVQNNETFDRYRLGAFNVIENFADEDEVAAILNGKNTKFKVISEQFGGGGYKSEFLHLPDNVYLDGQWIDERYSSSIENILRKELTLKKTFSDSAKYWEKKIIAAKNSVALHIRAGDYRILRWTRNFCTLPFAYYKFCVSELKKIFSDITVFVFCMEMDWARENLKFDVPTEFVEGWGNDDEEFQLMTLCQHDVIAWSTFSWWASRLNQNPNKKVFTPYPFQNGAAYMQMIKVTAADDPLYEFPPALSMIFYVGDGMSNVGIGLTTILNQNSKIDEIIIIDSSKDGSGKVCRQFAHIDKISLIKVDNSTTKYAAWNIGLDMARGEYVMFLDGNDFLVGGAIKAFLRVDMQYYQKFVATEGTAIRSMNDYVEYAEKSSNMILSTKRLKFNPAGNIEILGGKFFMEVDAPFKDLKEVNELKISDLEKLYLIISRQLNINVVSNFFKRKFLNEHKLHFDEDNAVNAELKFVVDALICTNRITIIPDCICGRV